MISIMRRRDGFSHEEGGHIVTEHFGFMCPQQSAEIELRISDGEDPDDCLIVSMIRNQALRLAERLSKTAADG